MFTFSSFHFKNEYPCHLKHACRSNRYKWVHIIDHVLYSNDVMLKTQSNYQNTYQNKI
jgi:hypothetical protein